ncbi:MAG TPA: hypothetical protein VNU71_13265 [Burkholderiaceae bacterium]|nr:hypothetical protein [Burkholderiaceae bacterium]
MDRSFLTPAAWLARATIRIRARDPLMALRDSADLAAAIAERVGWDTVPEVAVDATFRRERSAAEEAPPSAPLDDDDKRAA